MAHQRHRNSEAQARPVIQRAHRPDYQLVLYVGLLMLLGLIIMYAIGPQRAQLLNDAQGTDFSATYFVIKQAVSLVVASVGFALLAAVPLSIIRRHAGSILVAGLVASAVLLVFGNIFHVDQVAQCTLGACRWFELGPLGSFQPAELLKFGVLLFVARVLAEKIAAGNLNDWQESLYPILAVVGAVLLFVVVFQKDMGTGIAIVSIVASMLVVAGISARVGLKLLIGLLIAGALLIVTAPHRIERVTTFWQSDDTVIADVEDTGYHIRHAKIAIGSGGLIGVGIGNSVQATGYLPEAINDSVFAILGETFGFVGLSLLLVLFTALLFRLLHITERLGDPWMRLVAAGVFGWVASHVVLNIASMVGVFPLTGITLPLLSFGGTSMVFIAGALGIVFGMSRHTAHVSTDTIQQRKGAYANLDRWRGIGRTRHTGRRRNK